jgi:hypothetical protein
MGSAKIARMNRESGYDDLVSNVRLVVLLSKKILHSPVTSLGNMMGNACGYNACNASHDGTLNGSTGKSRKN